MKLTVRLFALTVVVAGAAAATTSSPKHSIMSAQAVTAKMPYPPMCNPTYPCPTQPSPGPSIR